MDSEGEVANGVEFQHFDSVNLALDHHYINSNKLFKNKNNTIMKEWRILKNNLPDAIYVQVYETRIDLLRAVIIGAAATPYHDSLFFFDIALPPDYPNEPPQVYYYSYGYRLNPNLYASGRVCLSLINTWSGSKAEKWTKGSTILQLLVSIQGLVLNARPYFNEPGLKMGKSSKLSMWVNASNRYNEDAFVLSCWTILSTIRHPLEGFEGFIVHHFRQRAASLLAAIQHYEEGLVLVGQFEMNGESPCPSSVVCVSAKFKSNLDKAYTLLYKAFDTFVPNLHNIVAETMIEVRRRKGEREELVKHEKEVKQHEKKAKQHRKGLLCKITSFVKKLVEYRK